MIRGASLGRVVLYFVALFLVLLWAAPAAAQTFVYLSGCEDQTPVGGSPNCGAQACGDWSLQTSPGTSYETAVWKHSGSASCKSSPVGTVAVFRWILATSLTSGTRYIGGWFYLPSLPASSQNISRISSSSDVDAGTVAVSSTGQVTLTNTADSSTITCSGTVSAGAEFWVAWKHVISDTVGEWELYLGAENCGSLANKDTLPTNVNRWRFGVNTSGTFTVYHDDAFLLTDQYPSSSWKVQVLTPNGDNTVAWTPLSGTNFSNVDDVPGQPNDADYNSTTTSPTVDRLDVTNLDAEVPSNATLVAANVIGRVNNTVGAGNWQLKFWDEASTLTSGTAFDAGTAFTTTNNERRLFLLLTGKTKANSDSFTIGYGTTTGTTTYQVSLVYANIVWMASAARNRLISEERPRNQTVGISTPGGMR